ncbi:MAG: DsbA family protein, partial [SAR324 cluster bacterium]|nr:DsbA family protein [SAR324 cluster bacterium]
MMEKIGTLYYFGDPMCSWCWGFKPVLEQVDR